MMGHSDFNLVKIYAQAHPERYPYITGHAKPEVPRRFIILNGFFSQDVRHAASTLSRMLIGVDISQESLWPAVEFAAKAMSVALVNPLVTFLLTTARPLWRRAI